jgi:hypothetical protein
MYGKIVYNYFGDYFNNISLFCMGHMAWGMGHGDISAKV